MSNISLTKLTIAVVIASLTSSIVFAGDNIERQGAKLSRATLSFNAIRASYNVDKNNILNAMQIMQNKAGVNVLNAAFATKDTDNDQ